QDDGLLGNYAFHAVHARMAPRASRDGRGTPFRDSVLGGVPSVPRPSCRGARRIGSGGLLPFLTDLSSGRTDVAPLRLGERERSGKSRSRSAGLRLSAAGSLPQARPRGEKPAIGLLDARLERDP